MPKFPVPFGISLEVNEENLPAIHLYEKFGFEYLGVRKNYYQDKIAIIMTKKLNWNFKA